VTLSGQLALIAAAMFSGAAGYINFAEQPARLGLSDQALLDEWKPACKRGTMMQAPLAVIGFLLGTWAWWQTGLNLYAVGAVLMLANLPVTLLGIDLTGDFCTSASGRESRKGALVCRRRVIRNGLRTGRASSPTCYLLSSFSGGRHERAPALLP
jgi:hypothetical protein